jgi:dihydroorotase
MKRLVIKGGHLIDPSAGIDGFYDIYVSDGLVEDIREAASGEGGAQGAGADTEVIDATGLLVVPGFVDVHVHLREPGFEYKETIATGAAAAAAGGFTTVLCMANTNPVNDNQSVTRYILRKAAEAALTRVLPIGAVSIGQRGKVLTEMNELRDAGCVAFSDDGININDPVLMRRALEYARPLGLPVITHAEDPSLSSGGAMNEGPVSTRLGLAGIPAASEESVVARDIALAELTGGRLHIAHVSTAGAVELVRNARKKGLDVTAEATPHHLVFSDEDIKCYDTNFKMSPPLRSRKDVAALREGIKDGTIECVATDHAPHSSIEKDVEWSAAANGVIGLETAFSALYGLVLEGVFSLGEVIGALTSGPARVMGLSAGSLAVGSPADVALIDTGATWTVREERIVSRSKNTPFLGLEMKGRVVRTMVGGRVVFTAGRGD